MQFHTDGQAPDTQPQQSHAEPEIQFPVPLRHAAVADRHSIIVCDTYGKKKQRLLLWPVGACVAVVRVLSHSTQTVNLIAAQHPFSIPYGTRGQFVEKLDQVQIM